MGYETYSCTSTSESLNAVDNILFWSNRSPSCNCFIYWKDIHRSSEIPAVMTGGMYVCLFLMYFIQIMVFMGTK